MGSWSSPSAFLLISTGGSWIGCSRAGPRSMQWVAGRRGESCPTWQVEAKALDWTVPCKMDSLSPPLLPSSQRSLGCERVGSPPGRRAPEEHQLFIQNQWGSSSHVSMSPHASSLSRAPHVPHTPPPCAGTSMSPTCLLPVQGPPCSPHTILPVQSRPCSPHASFLSRAPLPPPSSPRILFRTLLWVSGCPHSILAQPLPTEKASCRSMEETRTS